MSSDRVENARKLQKLLMHKIDSEMRQQEPTPTSTTSENTARRQLQGLAETEDVLVVIDLPVRGFPEDDNLPVEIGDSYRKYFTLPPQSVTGDSGVFFEVKRLQMKMASLRIFAANELHELITRYLDPGDIRACVCEVFPKWR